MNQMILPIIIGIAIGLAIGYVIAKIIEKKAASKFVKQARKQASTVLREAKLDADAIKKDKILQAKERFLELKSEHEQVILSRDKKMVEAEKRIRDKESQVSQQLDKQKKLNDSLSEKIESYNHKIEYLDRKNADLEKLHRKQVEQLEVISGLSADDAKAQLNESLKEEAKTDAMAFIQETLEEAKFTAQQEAKKIILNTIQRVGVEQSIENCVSVFNLESDDVKGRIIGREGRNIRAIEAATGVEIIVDDTPEAIILSCFDPIRREITRLSLHKLVTDGRIHPARIEEVVKKTEKEITNEITEVGKRTVIDLGIHGLHPELVKVVGRMKYRSSYGRSARVVPARKKGRMSAASASLPTSTSDSAWVDRYECLRERGLELGSRVLDGAQGLVLFLRRGMMSWMTEHTAAAPRPPSSSPPSPPERGMLDRDGRGEVTQMLASIVGSALTEART